MTRGGTGGTARRHRSSRTALLSLDGVTLRHRVGEATMTALDAVTVDVMPGELVAIRGDRRAGKTALLRVAAGMETPASGEVRICGLPIAGVSGGARTRRTRAVGYMPRSLRLAPGKQVVDQVALPLIADGVPLATAIARAHEALDHLDAIELADTPPHELDAGQLAFVALARALVRRPALLLADEPGATASSEDRAQILRTLQTLAREHADLGLLVTTRDTAGSAGAARVLTLADGQLSGDTARGRVIPLPARTR